MRDWRVIGAGLILAAIGLMCLVFGSSVTNHKNNAHYMKNRGHIADNRTRIDQLERELRAHNLPIPPPAIMPAPTTTVTVRRSVTSERDRKSVV